MEGEIILNDDEIMDEINQIIDEFIDDSISNFAKWQLYK